MLHEDSDANEAFREEMRDEKERHLLCRLCVDSGKAQICQEQLANRRKGLLVRDPVSEDDTHAFA